MIFKERYYDVNFVDVSQYLGKCFVCVISPYLALPSMWLRIMDSNENMVEWIKFIGKTAQTR